MPEIARFLGIVITMYHRDHSPPHFHAKYSGKSGIFSIQEIRMLEGNLPPRVISLVIEWALLHQEELSNDWDLAVSGKELKRIEPLV